MKEKEIERLRMLRELWQQRPPDKQTGNDVVVFYGWLEQNRPELLLRRHGDPYQQLQADLRLYIRAK